MKYDVDSFGENLKYYMRKWDISSQELAEKLFVSLSTVTNWRKNKNIPATDSLLLLAEMLNVSLDELFKKR